MEAYVRSELNIDYSLYVLALGTTLKGVKGTRELFGLGGLFVIDNC